MLINSSQRFKREKFQQRLRLFQTNQYLPLLNNHGLTGKWRGFRSINITGDWRAIFVVVDRKRITFVAFGTHSQLYG